jgi:gliding motility-associated-like protein
MADSIRIKISNSKPGNATNVLIEFKNEGSLPVVGSINLPVIRGNADTTLVIGFNKNNGSKEQKGKIKAEIISCDQKDSNPQTVYGSWKNSNWAGNPSQADEDVLNLSIYPNLRLMNKLQDTICSEETFIYTPQSNIGGVVFSWERASVYGIDETYNTGVGAINERLTNIDNMPVTVQYVYTLTTDFCPTPVTDTVTVVVLPKLPLTLTHYPTDGSIITFGTPITIVSNTTPNIYVKYRYSVGNTLIYKDDPDGGEYEYKIFEFNDGEFNTVQVTAINEYGCEVTGTEIFRASYNLPNLITPNENTNKRLLKNYDIQVFNRWGSELYHGKDGWDGTYRGSLVPAGTYLYILKYKQPNGNVLIMKHSVFVKY